jgi:hypothetical protein
MQQRKSFNADKRQFSGQEVFTEIAAHDDKLFSHHEDECNPEES